jgi:hypothetical protein
MKTLFESTGGAVVLESADDLDISIKDSLGNPVNVYEISALIFNKDSLGTGYTEADLGTLEITNDTTGHYHLKVPLSIPTTPLGERKIVWSLKHTESHNLTAHTAFFTIVSLLS